MPDVQTSPSPPRSLSDLQPASSSESQDPIVFISPREDFYTGSASSTGEVPEEPFVSESIDLPSYVLRQAATDLPTEDRLIAAYILTHLDEDGFLTTTALEVARYHHRLPSEITALIEKLKRCDPVGVCSANPTEAMLAQVEALSETVNVPAFTREVVAKYLHQMSQHHYPEIARALGTSSQQIQKIMAFISENLNPFPARAHWGDVRNPNSNDSQVFHQPDILITISMKTLLIPWWLRLSPNPRHTAGQPALQILPQTACRTKRKNGAGISKRRIPDQMHPTAFKCLKTAAWRLVVIQKDYIRVVIWR